MGLLSALLTPALVAAFVSLLMNSRQEKLRAKRDFITKAFDPSRDAVKEAVAATVVYFPLKASDRTQIMEAQILAVEREVRQSVTALLRLHQNPQPQSYHAAEQEFDKFISELTGGSFQDSRAAADISQMVKVADSGANLRAALTQMRLDVLQHDVETDVLSSAVSILSPKRLR